MQEGARVLVVDDDPDVRRMLERMVVSMGYGVVSAGDGPEALRLTESVDAVLLDIAMPSMDGIEVCRRLRRNPRTAAVPILLITGNRDPNLLVNGFDAGADDFVAKPFEPRELGARLRAHMDLSLARREVARLQGALATIRLISNDLNNPLQCVVGGVHLLRQAREGDAVDEEEALAMLMDGTEQMRELASRLVRITTPAFKDSPVGTMLDIEASH